MSNDPTNHDRLDTEDIEPGRPPLGLGMSVIIALAGLVVACLLLYLPHGTHAPVAQPAASTPAPTASAPSTPPASTPSTAPAAPTATSTPAATTPAATTPTTAPPAATTAPAAPPADEKLGPGLTLAIASKNGGATDRRSARLLSLFVAAKDSPTPFLEPGAFTATWDGYINLDVWNKVTFSAEGTGALTMTINGKPVLDIAGPDLAGTTAQLRLEKGKNRVVVTYTSPATGDAHVRVLWASADFPAEPVPPTVFSHNINDKELKTAIKLRHGRELIGTMRCTRCHSTDASADTGLPELATDAPDLRDAGTRLNQEWMAAWIADPKALRANATMPRLVRGKDDAETAQQAADIAAWLATLGKPAADPASTDQDVAAGGRVFATLGCVSCHTADSDTPVYIDLTHLKAKWKPAALAAFLQQPTKHYAWIRMPTFGFDAEQARKLAAFLLSHDQVEAAKVPAGDAGKGKALAIAAGCAACHQLGEGAAPKAPALATLGKKLSAGCLAIDDAARGKAPDFALESGDLIGLRAVLGSDLASLKRRSLPEFAERRITALRCAACHERDGADALLTSHGDAAQKILDALPPEDNTSDNNGEGNAAAGNPCPLLTFSGDKLRPEWMGAFIAGKIAYRTRPWLAKHMPFFPAAADLLAKGLAEEHGHPATTPPEAPVANAPPASAGKELVGQVGGLACISCHAIGSQLPVAVFEAPGINLGYAAQRLQKDYFHRWLLSPQRFDPTTRMPKFATDDGTTPLKNILGGKARDQFEAVWQYLGEVDKMTDYPH